VQHQCNNFEFVPFDYSNLLSKFVTLWTSVNRVNVVTWTTWTAWLNL
jgi:hypothetical protein